MGAITVERILALPYPQCCGNGHPWGPCDDCNKLSSLRYWLDGYEEEDFDRNGNLIEREEVRTLEHNPDLIGSFIDERCPKCGATLLGNKIGNKWCSNIGGIGMSACDYGLKEEPGPDPENRMSEDKFIASFKNRARFTECPNCGKSIAADKLFCSACTKPGSSEGG